LEKLKETPEEPNTKTNNSPKKVKNIVKHGKEKNTGRRT
jgi:hypothetical protein